jgi:hypothetical protein
MLLCAALCMPAAVGAVLEGITGNSGKQGTTCDDSCHHGGIAPEVRFEGPQSVIAGALVTFRFVVQSQSASQTIAGFNVAASGGTLDALDGQDERVEFEELTHNAPQGNVAGEATWEFAWRAPISSGPQTLFGAGLSANDNGTNSGDAAAATMLAVTVTPAAQSGDANCDGGLAAADVVAMVARLPDGVPSTCSLADTDCNGTVDQNDVAALIALLFDPTVAALCTN